MPSEGRLMRGRIRSKTRGLRGPRSRVFHCEPGCNAAVGSHPGGSGTGRQAVMAAATPQPSWQASLRGLQAETRHSLLRMWAYKRFGLLLLGLWGLLLLYYYLSPGFVNSASPSENTLWTNENANGQSLEKNSASRALLSFFFPTTCILKENQVVKPCNPLQDFNKTECLRNKCCYSSLKTSNFNCFVPLKDKPTQMFRMFGFGVISMLILGWLPIYCFSLCQRSRWANPLRRKMNRILKGLKKQRNKLKRDAEMLGTAMDEEGLGDEKEQETKEVSAYEANTVTRDIWMRGRWTRNMPSYLGAMLFGIYSSALQRNKDMESAYPDSEALCIIFPLRRTQILSEQRKLSQSSIPDGAF